MKNLKTSLVLIWLIFIFSACENEAEVSAETSENITACGVKDPLNNLVWLKDTMIKFDFARSLDRITLYKYKNQDIIEYYSLFSSNSKPFTFYCTGEMMNLDDSGDFDDYLKKRKNIIVLIDKFPRE